jgi:hypothetical protein
LLFITGYSLNTKKAETPRKQRASAKSVDISYVISSSGLNSAKELRYYAYLFLKDMGREEGVAEPQLPKIPKQFAGIYDNPGKLIEIIKNHNQPLEMRQTALARVRELSPLNNYPENIFDREIYRKQATEILRKKVAKVVSETIAGFRSAYYVTDEEVNEVLSQTYSPAGNAEQAIQEKLFRHPGSEVFDEKWERKMVEEEVQRLLAKLMVEEFPALLAQYESELNKAVFPDSAIARADDLYTDSYYLILQGRLGEARAKEIWNSPEKLLQAIEGKFSGECKNIFAARLRDLTILTLAEQKRVVAGLRDIYEDMFYGESFGPIPLVDTNVVEVVDKSMLEAEKTS